MTRTTRLPEGAVGAGAAASPAEVDGAEEEDEEDAEGPAAKKKRSRASTATCVTGCGNEKVDRREAGEVDRSQICEARFGVEEWALASIPLAQGAGVDVVRGRWRAQEGEKRADAP